MKKNEIPNYFKNWELLFNQWYDYLTINKITALEACISFIKNQKDIDKVVIGVDSAIHLNQILKAFSSNKEIKKFELEINDRNLLKPFLWKN